MKDLRTNRQLDNVVRHIATLKDLTTQESDNTSTINDELNVEGENDDNKHLFQTLDKEKSTIDLPVETATCIPHEEKTSLVTKSQTITVPTFKVPRVEEQLIRRRLKKTFVNSDSHVSRQNLNPNSKAVLSSSKQLSQTVCYGTPEHPGSSEHSCQESDPCSINKEPTISTLQSNRLISVSHTTDGKIDKRNIDTSTSQSFGKPKAKRRSIREEIVKPSSISKLSLEFPFTPLVTKTRLYAKLDHAGKLKRLQGSGANGLGKKSIKEKKGGLRTTQPVKRMHQLSVKTFMRPPAERQGNTLMYMCT